MVAIARPARSFHVMAKEKHGPGEDPREQGKKPPFAKKSLEPPGRESEMEPRPDYGADSYRGFGRLKDRVAVITGADSGIGRAVALAFAREGADVVISYWCEHDDAAETRRALEEAGPRALTIPGDLSSDAACKALIDRAVSEFGRIDLLVNNAASQGKE